jgi:hypothetical protein
MASKHQTKENIAGGERLTVPMRFIATEDIPAWFPNETFPKGAKLSNTVTELTTTNIGGKDATMGLDGGSHLPNRQSQSN